MARSHEILRTHRWRRFRRRVLAEEPLCRLCASRNRWIAAAELHHVQPLHKRPDLAFARDNVMPLCRPCHRGRPEHGPRRRLGADRDGNPRPRTPTPQGRGP